MAEIDEKMNNEHSYHEPETEATRRTGMEVHFDPTALAVVIHLPSTIEAGKAWLLTAGARDDLPFMEDSTKIERKIARTILEEALDRIPDDEGF